MSFDGDTQFERPVFDNTEDAWKYDSDIGSKWYFYPFRFLVSVSRKTILDTCTNMEWAVGKRVQTIKKIFKDLSEDPEMIDVGVDEFTMKLFEQQYGG
jgi:hypothetical protein